MDNTHFDFNYISFINELIKTNNITILCGSQSDAIKGLTLSTGHILINLSSPHWRFLTEDQLISEIAKTIAHEYIHSILYKYDFPNKGEEKVCQILANQREDLNPTEIETFI